MENYKNHFVLFGVLVVSVFPCSQVYANSIEMGLDSCGRVVSLREVILGVKQETLLKYDHENRLILSVTPGLRTFRYGYDEYGKLANLSTNKKLGLKIDLSDSNQTLSSEQATMLREAKRLIGITTNKNGAKTC